MTATLEVPDTLTARTLPPFRDQLAALSAERSGRPIVLKGRPDLFSSGLGLSEVAGPEADASSALAALVDCLRVLQTHDGASIAVVEGMAAGGGLGLAAACDVVVAGRQARFALPELLLGLTPATIAPFVLGRIGAHRMRLMMLDGAARDAAWALENGLADHLEEAEDLARLIRRVTRTLARGEGQAIRAARAMTLPPGLGALLEAGAQDTLARLRTETVQARIAAFNDGGAPWA
ncbi:MAG: enoyl-CoA hydratase-related protein [Pseudomonadota bacterium]